LGNFQCTIYIYTHHTDYVVAREVCLSVCHMPDSVKAAKTYQMCLFCMVCQLSWSWALLCCYC